MNIQSIFLVVCVVSLCSMALLAIYPLRKQNVSNAIHTDLDADGHIDTDRHSKKHGSKHSNLATVLLFVAIPLLTLVLYVCVSDRSSVIQQWRSQSNYEQVVQSYFKSELNDSDKQSDITGAKQLAQDFYQKHLHNQSPKQQNQLLQAMIHEVHTHSDKPRYWFQLAELMVTMSQHRALNLDYLVNGANTAYYRAYHLANKQPSTHTRPMHAQHHSFYYGMVYAQYNFQNNNQSLDDYAYQTLQSLIQRQPDHEGAYMMMLMHHIGKKEYKTAYDIANQLETSLVQKGNRNSAIEKIEQIKQVIHKNLNMQEK